MKRSNLLFWLCLLLPGLAAAGPGEQNTETRSVPAFTEISVGQSISVILTPGPEPKVTVSTGGNLDLSDVHTEVQGDRLRISVSRDWRGNSYVEVEVFYQSLHQVRASSSAKVSGEEVIRTDDFFVDASSSARVQLNLEADKVRMDASSGADLQLDLRAREAFGDASSGANLKLSGQTQRMVLEASSGSYINAGTLETKQAILDASSGAYLELKVTESLEAEASSGAAVRYRGDPRVLKKERSGATVRRKR